MPLEALYQAGDALMQGIELMMPDSRIEKKLIGFESLWIPLTNGVVFIQRRNSAACGNSFDEKDSFIETAKTESQIYLN